MRRDKKNSRGRQEKREDNEVEDEREPSFF